MLSSNELKAGQGMRRLKKHEGISGKRVVMTGATSGLGLAAAIELAEAGARLAIIARNMEKAERAAERIGGTGAKAPDILLGDVSSLRSIRRLADEILGRYPSVDILVNNAGAYFRHRQVSEEGIELTWATNYLGHFLLTNLLLDRLKASAPARIINTASGAHVAGTIPFDDLNADSSYSGFRRYAASRLGTILFTTELARRLAGTGVTANCFHPGFVATGLYRSIGVFTWLAMLPFRPFMRSPHKGADTLVWLATSDEASGISGAYFADRRPRNPSAEARDPLTASRLWMASEAQIAAAEPVLKRGPA